MVTDIVIVREKRDVRGIEDLRSENEASSSSSPFAEKVMDSCQRRLPTFPPSPLPKKSTTDYELP